ncbi:RING-H2 finger protein ATL57-like [Cryptomeria japonica]|uniref:RING-H2 finger protein ATL57-like n=1 Tax=Cryptomeria japonica TaxID=3369 RepID=UPI0027DA9CFC|nr:RING-H2 finger protein ATL57-like [Cryptomeria japonica]
MVRPRSSSSYVDGASASTGPVEQPPPSSSSYSVDDELRGPLEQPLEMGVYSYRCHGEEQQEECVICLCEYQEGDSLVALPRCQHCFHVECIRRWFKCQLRCPICNASPFQELGSHAGKDVALQIPLPPLLVAGNMREGNLGSEHNV